MKKITNETEVNLNSCGYSLGVNLIASGFYSIDTSSSMSFILKKGYRGFFIIRGTCTFSLFGKKHFCQQNDILIQFQDRKLTLNINDNIDLYYIDISGEFIHEAINNLMINNEHPMIHGLVDSRIKNLFQFILSHHNINISTTDKSDVLFSVVKIIAILIESNQYQSWQKVLFSDPRILYTGHWVSWPTREKSTAEEFYTANKSSYVEYNFYGSGIKWVGTINFDCGLADIIIDGNYVTTIDTYNSVRITKQVLYINTNLDKGHHIIKVFCTGNKNQLSTNTDITLESFHVYNDELIDNNTGNNTYKSIINFISLNLSTVNINIISDKFNISRGSLLKIFRDEINMTVSDYISSMKIKRAKSFLVSGKLSIKEISDTLGYCNYSYFIKVFKEKVGISPVDYKKRNKL